MAKVVRVAALVVAVAAAIPSGGTSLLAAGIASTGAAAATGIAAATLASGLTLGLGLAAAVLAKPPKSPSIGTQTQFKADPNAPIPYVVGRTLVGGDIRYWKAYGSNNEHQNLVVVLSGGGPIDAIEQTFVDKVSTDFQIDGLKGFAVGKLSGWLSQNYQLGACPEPAALTSYTGGTYPPGWSAAHKLSGYAAVMLGMSFDAKGDGTFTTTPKMGWVVRGTHVYDPRLDDTFPGGSGPCRALDEDTYVYSENPYLHALTYALGRYQNGKRVLGVGQPFDSIDVAAFVEGANICDANGWKVGGQVDSGMGKWDVLKLMLQAGAGEPIHLGAKLSCFINAPRVSLDTITRNDIIGDCTIPGTQTRRDRINGIIPRYRSEDHGWEVVSAGLVTRSEYVNQDGAARTREMDYPLVQCFADDTPDQASQLAAYDIANAREAGPITFPLKPRWLGYRTGDCITVGAEETGIAGTQLVILSRTLDPSSGTVTMTFRTETPGKHTWALSQVGEAAPTTTPGNQPILLAPDASDWAVSVSTSPVPMLIVEGGTSDSARITAVEFDYRKVGDATWTSAGSAPSDAVVRKEITGVDISEAYEVSIRYRVIVGFLSLQRTDRLILGPTDTIDTGPKATDLTATGGTGSADLTWRNPTIAGWSWLQIHRGTTSVFADATVLPDQLVGGLGEVLSVTDSGLAAGSLTYWVVAYASDGTPYSPSAPDTVTVA